MTTFDSKNAREEIAITLKNGNLLSTSVRGVTTTTDNFTATSSQTVFTLAHTPVRNIRSLTINSVSKTYLRHYTVNFTTGAVTLLTGATLNDPVAIQYDYGGTEKIFTDWPRDDITLSSFPRVSVMETSTATEPFALGGGVWLTDALFTIFIWLPVNHDTGFAGGLGGTADLETIKGLARSIMQTNEKLLVKVPYIYPTTSGPIIPAENFMNVGGKGKVIQTSLDCKAKFIIE